MVVTTAVPAISIPHGLKKNLTEGDWRVLHIFEPVCNLANEKGELLSLVHPKIGNGPFNVVVPPIEFPASIEANTSARIYDGQLHIGALLISLGNAQGWEAKPHWEILRKDSHCLKSAVVTIERLLALESPLDSFARLSIGGDLSHEVPLNVGEAAMDGISVLSDSLVMGDSVGAGKASGKLAGLGGGLTPAGDDFLMGVLHAIWSFYPEPLARKWSRAIVEASTPKTTLLSAAWLKAAGAGEAGEVWHRLLQAIEKSQDDDILHAARAILPTGHSSGADALGGFAFACRRLLV